MTDFVHPVRSLVSSRLAEEKELLQAMQSGTHRAPWHNDTQHAEAIEECKERIASLQGKLDDSDKMREWWDSIPDAERPQLLNE